MTANPSVVAVENAPRSALGEKPGNSATLGAAKKDGKKHGKSGKKKQGKSARQQQAEKRVQKQRERQKNRPVKPRRQRFTAVNIGLLSMATEGIYNMASAFAHLPAPVAGAAAGTVWLIAGAESVRSKIEDRRSENETAKTTKKYKGDRK